MLNMFKSHNPEELWQGPFPCWILYSDCKTWFWWLEHCFICIITLQDGHPVMAAGSPLGHIGLWDLEDKKLIGQMRDAHSTAIAGLTFLHAEPLLLTNGADNAIRVCVQKHLNLMLFSREGSSSFFISYIIIICVSQCFSSHHCRHDFLNKWNCIHWKSSASRDMYLAFGAYKVSLEPPGRAVESLGSLQNYYFLTTVG